MRTWLLEGALSIGLFLLLTPILIAPFIAWVYRRYRYPAPMVILLSVCAGLYASALVAFTTFPLPDRPDDFCTERAAYDYWRLTPGESFAEVAAKFGEVGPAAGLASGVFLQVAFNVAFFVPLGFLLAYWGRRGIGWAVGAGLAVSLLIEVTQGSALWGIYPCPYRVAEIDDLITNTSGALLGWLLGVLATRLIPYRPTAPREDLQVPSIKRRVVATGLDLTVAVVISFVVDVVLLVIDDSDGEPPGWMTAIPVAVGLVVFVIVPAVRDDSATPGQASVLLALSRAEDRPANIGSILVRFVLRWLPIIIWGLPALVVVALLEGVTVMLRADRRSLSGLVAGTTTTTRDRLIGFTPPSRPDALG